MEIDVSGRGERVREGGREEERQRERSEGLRICECTDTCQIH